MSPDIEQLKLTLKRGKGCYVPIVELGVHATGKEGFLGKEIRDLLRGYPAKREI